VSVAGYETNDQQLEIDSGEIKGSGLDDCGRAGEGSFRPVAGNKGERVLYPGDIELNCC